MVDLLKSKHSMSKNHDNLQLYSPDNKQPINNHQINRYQHRQETLEKDLTQFAAMTSAWEEEISSVLTSNTVLDENNQLSRLDFYTTFISDKLNPLSIKKKILFLQIFFDNLNRQYNTDRIQNFYQIIAEKIFTQIKSPTEKISFLIACEYARWPTNITIDNFLFNLSFPEQASLLPIIKKYLPDKIQTLFLNILNEIPKKDAEPDVKLKEHLLLLLKAIPSHLLNQTLPKQILEGNIPFALKKNLLINFPETEEFNLTKIIIYYLNTKSKSPIDKSSLSWQMSLLEIAYKRLGGKKISETIKFVLFVHNLLQQRQVANFTLTENDYIIIFNLLNLSKASKSIVTLQPEQDNINDQDILAYAKLWNLRNANQVPYLKEKKIKTTLNTIFENIQNNKPAWLQIMALKTLPTHNLRTKDHRKTYTKILSTAINNLQQPAISTEATLTAIRFLAMPINYPDNCPIAKNLATTLLLSIKNNFSKLPPQQQNYLLEEIITDLTKHTFGATDVIWNLVEILINQIEDIKSFTTKVKIVALLQSIFKLDVHTKTLLEEYYNSKSYPQPPKNKTLAKRYQLLQKLLTIYPQYNPLLYNNHTSDTTSKQIKKKQGKDLPTITLNSLAGQIVIRQMRIPSFLAWQKAFEINEEWEKAGFKHIPIEPIHSFKFILYLDTTKKEIIPAVQIFTGSLGISLAELKTLPIPPEIHETINSQKNQLNKVLEANKIHFTAPDCSCLHDHHHNYVILFQPTNNKKATAYTFLIDWDMSDFD